MRRSHRLDHYTRPDHTIFDPSDEGHYLPNSCALRLTLIVGIAAVVLLAAMALHPQGLDLIPWMLEHM